MRGLGLFPAVFVLCLFFTMTILSVSAQTLTEYREVIFYPDGRQKVIEDWFVVYIEEDSGKYGAERYNAVITYRNASVEVQTISQKDNLSLYHPLEAENVNISIVAVIEKGERDRVIYNVYNNYSQEIFINVTMPYFEGFIDCESCQKDNMIYFNLTVPPHGSSSFRIYASGRYSIPDADVSFEINTSARMMYKVPLDFSITKNRVDNRWFATFEVRNQLNDFVNASLKGWVITGSNRTDLFDERITLSPGETVVISRDIVSSETPVFYLKVDGVVESSIPAKIVPVKSLEDRYITGYGVLKGFSGLTTIAKGKKLEVTPTPTATPTPIPTPTPAFTPEELPTPSPSPTPSAVSIKSPIELLPEPVREVATVVMLPATYVLMLSLILSPAFSNRGIVVDRRSLNPQNYRILRSIGKRIFLPRSTPLEGCYIVEVDKEIVERLSFNLNLSAEEAETLAVALMLKKPLFTTSRKLFEAAIKSGCVAYLIGNS
jgi:hypothetical protein